MDTGQWSAGHVHGQGVYGFSHGGRYEGTFSHGSPHGQGQLTYPDGGYYNGEFLAMRTVVTPNEEVLKVPAYDGKRHGAGTRVWTNGSRFQGQWERGMMNGKGVLSKADGSKYEGTFRNNLR